MLLTVPIAAVSLAVRFRRARGLERQQLRWLAFAAGLASVGAVLVLAGTSLPTSTATTLALDHLGRRAVPGPAPPGHRRRHPALPALNLDQISSRTVAYGLLTLLLAGGYAGIVLGLGRLLGRESSLVVAAATLAVVALFQPARGGFKRWSTGTSTAAATTPPAPSTPSRCGSATSST